MPFAYAVFDASGALSQWNGAFARLLDGPPDGSADGDGSSEADGLERALERWFDSGELTRDGGWREAVLSGAHPAPLHIRIGVDRYEIRSSRREGGETSVLILSDNHRDGDDRTLAESEAYFRTLFDNAPVSLFEEDWSGVKTLVDGLPAKATRDIRASLLADPALLTRMAATVRLRNVNATAVETYEATSKAALIASFNGLEDYLGTDGMRDIFISVIEGFLKGDGIVVHEGSDITREGRKIYVKTTSTLMPPHKHSWRRVVQVLENITAFKEAEDRLHHAQKMEALGQFTGGVAHDFNNLLAVIQGNAELMDEDPETASPLVSAILRASERGARLTQRLLAFARQQPLRPAAVDIGGLVTGMTDLLARMLGATVEIGTRVPAGLWPALADTGQIENALLNLAINARDAMPDGGALTISCRNVTLREAGLFETDTIPAGDYVVLSVSDIGTGMPEHIRAQAFEPFFTTKGAGQGSGLGLSMVYGFARQSGGTALVHSEEGKGTTVELYLPRAGVDATPRDMALPDTAPRGRGETILVIEDDPDVRLMAVTMLRTLGYAVVSVADAALARRAVDQEPHIRLVLSDVILPGGTSGPAFAEELRASRPDIKVVFMSGYPANPVKFDGFLEYGSSLLNKPFQSAQLATAIRTALEG